MLRSTQIEKGILVAHHYPTYAEWFDGLSDEMKEKTMKLVERFRTQGCDNPEGWTRSEISENFAQFARFIFLRDVWEYIGLIAKSAGGSKSPRSRMMAAGVSSEDICAFARGVAYSTAFAVINRIDEGRVRNALGGCAWVETHGNRFNGRAHRARGGRIAREPPYVRSR
jgi:hypothetical protein